VGNRTTFGYARPDDGAYIGYRVDGEGPIDIVLQPDWPGNIDMHWQNPQYGPLLRSLSSFARVIVHDHRGVGLSSRDVGLPNLETRVSDLLAVLRATAARRPILVGLRSSGAVHVLLAAMRPRLPRALVWLEPMARYGWAPDYSWGVTDEERELERDYLGLWGTDDYAKAFAEEVESLGNPHPPQLRPFIAMHSRNACTPDVALSMSDMWYETDVRGVLDAVNVPTLLLVHEGRQGSIEEAEHIASYMPAAEVRRMPGLAWTIEEQPAWVDEIRGFIGVAPPSLETDTVLSTVLFTDVVGSTERQASLGDRAWKDLISKHHAVVRETLDRYHGVEIDTAGDGFYATFDGPARAVRCALDIAQHVRDFGIEIRAGVHTGECELIDNKVGGISVTTGKRISDLAGPSEVLASQTVKDLVAGSGIAFEDAGEHELKGVPNHWHLYRVVSGPE
jgi:class 3 adenylate cyclase/pimeloyl-ACP methyl ester carboxylesterase